MNPELLAQPELLMIGIEPRLCDSSPR